MSEIDKEKDIDQLMYRELSPDRYCYIHNYIVDLQNQLQQKENIIKEVREILNQDKTSASFNTAERKVLEILDKENK